MSDLVERLRKFQAEEPGFPQIFVQAVERLTNQLVCATDTLRAISENKNWRRSDCKIYADLTLQKLARTDDQGASK